MYPSLVIFHTAKFAFIILTPKTDVQSPCGGSKMFSDGPPPRPPPGLPASDSAPLFQSTATDWAVESGNVLFMTLIMESLGETGFPFPEVKIIYRMFLKFFCCLHFFLLPQSLSHLNRVSNIPSQKKDNLSWCSFGWYVLYQTSTYGCWYNPKTWRLLLKLPLGQQGLVFNFVWFPEPLFPHPLDE